MTIEVSALTGSALADGLQALANLRIEVFRAFPYLYDGDMDYETAYLTAFAAAPGAVIVAARHDGEIVGCATAAPLPAVDPAFSAPFRAAGLDIGRIFYCGESVLRPVYRSRGLGHAFFDYREAQARKLGGFTTSAFCAVVRPADHRLRPAGYQSLEPFWIKRGYSQAPGMVCSFSWKDIDQPRETAKPMQFWTRELAT